MPALHGNPLDREAIFTYFPHAPNIPEWLPPSVSVHQGDWKLIRIFHGGQGGKHRFKLFNLNDDLGETKNLAADLPERVKAMDAMIEEFLVDTDAVVPLPNPNFDPAKYEPELEGKAKLKGGANAPPKNKRSAPRAKPIAGWQPEGDCSLTIENGALVFTSNGGDPHASYSLPKSISRQALTLRFTMASDSAGGGQVFWQEQGIRPAFNASRSITFEVQHDGTAHDYSVEFTPGQPVVGIRIDPSRGRGKMRLTNIRLTRRDGQNTSSVRYWPLNVPVSQAPNSLRLESVMNPIRVELRPPRPKNGGHGVRLGIRDWRVLWNRRRRSYQSKTVANAITKRRSSLTSGSDVRRIAYGNSLLGSKTIVPISWYLLSAC